MKKITIEVTESTVSIAGIDVVVNSNMTTEEFARQLVKDLLIQQGVIGE